MRLARLLIISMSLASMTGCGGTSTQPEPSTTATESTKPADAPADDQVIKFGSLDSGYEGTTVVKPDGTQISN